MGITTSADVNFSPKVWSDHSMAHFDRKMGLGQLALIDRTLQSEPGESVNFPFYNKIGAVEEAVENTALSVDKLTDGSFNVTIKEIGKAVGWTDKSKRVSAQKDPEGEAQRQLGILYAEKVDQDLVSLINTSGNYSTALTALDYATGKLNINKLLEHNIVGFGDKAEESVAFAMHSLHFLELMNNSGNGFLTKNDNDPFNGVQGFQGRILNRAVFVLDTMPEQAAIDGKKAFPIFSFKANPYGIYMAEELKIERDRDILTRENLIASTMWYGTLGLHAKIAASDKRVIRSVLPTGVSA
jgi:hypothetical protein